MACHGWKLAGRPSGFWLAFLLGLATFTASAEPTRAQVAYLDASKALLARMDDASQTGELPRKTDARVAAWLATLTDSKAVLDDGAANDETIEMQICQASGLIAARYMYSGAEVIKEPVDSTAFGLAERELATINEAKYQDELSGLLAFNVACAAKSMEAADKMFKTDGKDETQHHALAERTRSALLGMFQGVLTQSTDARISLRNRAMVLSSWSDHAAKLARGLPVKEREQLVKAIAVQEGKIDPSLRPLMNRIENALRAPVACEGLCAA